VSTTPHIALEAAFQFDRTEASDPTMADWLEDVVEHLYKLDARSLFVVSDDDQQKFVVSLTLEAPQGSTPESVADVGMTMIRTAAHACGAATPDWPTTTEVMPALRISLIEAKQKVLQAA
jgi:hypothetical protein